MSMIDTIGWSLVIIGAVVAAIAVGCVVGDSMRIRLPDYSVPPWTPPRPLTLPPAIDLDLDYSSAKTPIGIGKSHST